MKVLIDGDILTYRAAFSCEDASEWDAVDKIDTLIEEIMDAVSFDRTSSNYEVFLTGRGNFRTEIQPTYKANRTGRPKPEHLPALRNHLVDEYCAKVSVGQEADDDIAIRATEIGPEAIIASVDKDFLQVPCHHYNITRGTTVKVEEFGVLKFFYGQILTGDAADNVFGLKGIGPVKSGRMLLEATTELGLYKVCLEAYGGDEAKVIENAKLLWLRREEGQVWCPPSA